VFWVTKQILKSYHDKGFAGVEIFGQQGLGKTTYALKVMKQVYQELGVGDPWNQALSMTFFDVEDFIPLLVEARVKGERIPVVLFDDAGIWLEKYAWQRETIRGFIKLYKMIRTFVSAVIFTTPSPEDIVKNIREKAWFQIKIVRSGRNQSGTPLGQAMLFKYEVKKDGNSLRGVVREEAIDTFAVRLPQVIYEKYEKMRVEQGIDPQLRDLLEYFPKAKEKLSEMGIKPDFLNDKNGEPADAD